MDKFEEMARNTPHMHGIQECEMCDVIASALRKAVVEELEGAAKIADEHCSGWQSREENPKFHEEARLVEKGKKLIASSHRWSEWKTVGGLIRARIAEIKKGGDA